MALAESLAVVTARRGWLAALFGGILFPLAVFGLLANEVWEREGFGWDNALLLAIHAHATHALDAIMLVVTNATAPLALSPIIGVGVLLLLWRGQRRAAGFMVVATGGSALLNVGAKLLFARARPALWPSVRGETDYSFPSGHAMGSMALVVTVLALLWMTRWRWPALVIGGGFVVLVGISRVYLGAHFPSDVVAGWVAAFAWVTGVRLFWYVPHLRE